MNFKANKEIVILVLQEFIRIIDKEKNSTVEFNRKKIPRYKFCCQQSINNIIFIIKDYIHEVSK